MIRHPKPLALALYASFVFLTGCVQLPTESQGAVDMRPRIGFSVASGISAPNARVWVDGLDVGSLNEYRDNAGTLIVLPGNHLVQVREGAQLLLEEKVFLADGARRSLIITSSSKP